MQSERQITHVKNSQGVHLAKLARENGISRKDFSEFLKDGWKVKKFFDELKNGYFWFEKLLIEANKIGVRVCLLPELVVDYTRPHDKYVMAGGPETSSNFNVLKMADKYQPSENKITEETIVLLKWPHGHGILQKAIKWGLLNGLSTTTPHVPFAIGEQEPKLNYKLGSYATYIVETTGCLFEDDINVCCLWYFDSRRESFLFHQNRINVGDGWLAFRRLG